MHLCTNISELLKEGRLIWPDKMTAPDIALSLAVILGRICYDVRQGDPIELKRDLGNLIFSAIRWCDDLGFDPDKAVRMALTEQTVLAKAIKDRKAG